MNGSWDAHLASPADFAGKDDIITNLAKEREPGIKIIERLPNLWRMIFTSFTISEEVLLENLKCMWRLVNPVFVFCLKM